MRALLFAFLALGLGGCAHSVHEVHVSDFNPAVALKDGTPVRGYAEQFVVLGITQETSYVEKARDNLMRACPGGAITAISTQYSTSLGFFSWTNKILMQGLCVARR